MKQLLFVASLTLLGICNANAQVLRSNYFSVGSTLINLFDSQWVMPPSLSYRRYGLWISPITYRRTLNLNSIISFKIFSAKRSKPPKYYSAKFPHAQERNIGQLQTTYGKYLFFKNWQLSAHAGIAYQLSTKLQYVSEAVTSGGWVEIYGVAGRKSSVGLPFELSINRIFFNRINIGLSGNYTYSISDYKYDYNEPLKPERHLLLTSLSIGFEFGKPLVR